MKIWLVTFVALIYGKKARSFARRAVRKLSRRKHGEHDARLPRSIPKKIWMFWDQGEADAPPLVRACIDSWRRHNPDWEIIVLDNMTVQKVIDMPRRSGGMSIQHFADILRLKLLRRYGGVWIDVTVWCLRPLDQWLPVFARDGFFAPVWSDADKSFVLPNVHRVICNWFLASEPEGEIISAWDARTTQYWEGRTGAHDYYWQHMLLEYLCLTDRPFRRRFEAVPKMGAYSAHLVHDYICVGKDRTIVRAVLQSGAAPIQKLRWNWGPDELARAREVLDGLPELEAL